MDAEREQHDRRSLRLSPGGQDVLRGRPESRVALGDPGCRRARLPCLGCDAYLLPKAQSRQVRNFNGARKGSTGPAFLPRTRYVPKGQAKIAVLHRNRNPGCFLLLYAVMLVAAIHVKV